MAWIYLRLLNVCGFLVAPHNLQVRQGIVALQMMYAQPLAYSFALVFSKTAILLDWVRLFSPQGIRGTFWWIAHVLITLHTLFYTAAIVASVLHCVPIEATWYVWIPGKCYNVKALRGASGCFNVVTDVAILVLPLRSIWSLRMSTRKRIGVSAIFSVGLLAIACALGRLHSTFQIPGDQFTQEYMDSGGDPAYEVGVATIWCMAEVSCVILVFCMPALPQALKGITSGFVWQRLTSRLTITADRKSASGLDSC